MPYYQVRFMTDAKVIGPSYPQIVEAIGGNWDIGDPT